MFEVLILIVMPAVVALFSLAGAVALYRTREQEPRTARAVMSIVLGTIGVLVMIAALGMGACFGYLATYRI